MGDDVCVRVIYCTALGIGLGLLAFIGHVDALAPGSSLTDPDRTQLVYAGIGGAFGFFIGVFAHSSGKASAATPPADSTEPPSPTNATPEP
ncbi:MAG TPA: hypothetical protein VGL44_12655 [Gaiellales bacterium]